MSKEAIEQIRKEIKNGQTDEVYLDDIHIVTISPELKKELESIPDLMCLSLNNCGLTSLANFPNTPSLIRLELMENKFGAKDLEFISHISELQSLSLGSNKVASITDLNPLKKLSNLIQLDLSDTDLAKKPDYRKTVFALLPHLQVLDNLDVDGNEYEYSSEEEGDEDDLNGEEDDDEDGEDEDDDKEDFDEDDDGEGEGDDDEDDEDDEDGDADGDDDEEEDERPAQKRRR